MYKCFNTVKDKKEERLLAIFGMIARKLDPSNIKTIYKYVRPYHNQMMIGIRYELEDEKSFTYNILENRYKQVLLAIEHIEDPEALKWLGAQNEKINPFDFAVGSGSQYRFGPSGLILHPFLKNINPSMIEIPLTELDKATKVTFKTNVTTGDIEYIDNQFLKVSNKFKDIVKRIKASCAIIDADPKACKDHDLYFAFYTDNFRKSKSSEDFRIGACLTKAYPHLAGNTLIINSKEMDVNDLGFDPEGSSYMAACNIEEAVKEFDGTVKDLTKYAEKYPDLEGYIDEGILQIYMLISNHTEMIYRFNMEDGRAAIEKVANEIYAELSTRPNVGLDINSWKVWDYTTPDEPVLVKDLNYTETILDDYTPTFVDALSVFLRDAGNPMVRPYAKLTQITDEEDIAKTPIGSIRMERTKTIE